jgi:hypothetical protein
LLDYLSTAFIEHDYDIRWLMREVVNSDTYQRSWKTNPTNEFDLRNFSHAVPRRLQAEVVLDAVATATAGKSEAEQRAADPVERCSIGLGQGYTARNNGAAYALSVFGKPKRETPCDCERSNEPSLLQTVYLRNDQEMFNLITRRNGWWSGVATGQASAGDSKGDDLKSRIRAAERQVADLQDQRAKLERSSNKNGKNKDEAKRVYRALTEARRQLEALNKESSDDRKSQDEVVALSPAKMVDEAYLRTFSRYPTDDERKQAETYLKESTDVGTGLRDLVWALMNSKEFVVNH